MEAQIFISDVWSFYSFAELVLFWETLLSEAQQTLSNTVLKGLFF